MGTVIAIFLCGVAMLWLVAGEDDRQPRREYRRNQQARRQQELFKAAEPRMLAKIAEREAAHARRRAAFQRWWAAL